VDAGALTFSVLVYSCVSILAVALLMLRRMSSTFGRAELGGPSGPAHMSAAILLALWLAYVSLSAADAYGAINPHL